MSRVRLVLLSLVAVLSVGAVLASSASAAIKFEWKVGGVPLAAGETVGFTVTSDGKTFDFHSTVAGTGVLLLSNSISVEPGAVIRGGKPGTNLEEVLFHNVTADPPFQNCLVETDTEKPTVGLVRTALLHTEIVESDDPGNPGEPLILFTPEGPGTTFVTLLFLNKNATEKCPAGTLLTPVTGSLLAQPLPSLVETLNGDLDFEALSKNYILSNGVLDTAGLFLGANPASLTGLALVILNTDEKYGAF